MEDTNSIIIPSKGYIPIVDQLERAFTTSKCNPSPHYSQLNQRPHNVVKHKLHSQIQRGTIDSFAGWLDQPVIPYLDARVWKLDHNTNTSESFRKSAHDLDIPRAARPVLPPHAETSRPANPLMDNRFDKSLTDREIEQLKLKVLANVDVTLNGE
jgi:hypothetical protein